MDPVTSADDVTGPRVAITYCTRCNWLPRAAWVAQELLQTFSTDLLEVALVPGTGGVFRIAVGEQTVWDRRRDGGVPDIVEIKRRVRDRAAPDRSLGHADRVDAEAGETSDGGQREPPLPGRRTR